MVLFFIVHTKCDLCCKDCFYSIGHEKRDSSALDLQDVDLFVQRVCALGFKTVILTGGDPLYSRRKHITYALVECLKNSGRRVIINTSGANLTLEDLQTLVDIKVDRIDFSINSLDEKLHNAERGKFHDTVFAIKNLLKMGYKNIATTTVITEENADKALDTLRWLKSLGVEDIRYQPLFKNTAQNYGVLREAMVKCNREFGKAHSKNFLLQCDSAYGGGDPLENSVCLMGKELFISDALGNIYPCFHRFDVKLGNLFEDDTALLIEKLQKCEFYSPQHTCFGKHCVSLFDNGDFWEKEK